MLGLAAYKCRAQHFKGTKPAPKVVIMLLLRILVMAKETDFKVIKMHILKPHDQLELIAYFHLLFWSDVQERDCGFQQ